MTVKLTQRFVDLPLAHRTLHDSAAGRPENSIAGAKAAIAHGYGIEIDIQMSGDGVAMVFHDYELDRLTAATGRILERSAAELGAIPLNGCSECIPTLAEFLDVVAGRVPVLVEVKDQDGALGPNVGSLEEAVTSVLEVYEGEVAVMSFNPHSVAAFQELLPKVARGLTTDAFSADDWPVPEGRLAEVRGIPDFDRVGATFISHNRADLTRECVVALKNGGADILCWTVRSEAEESQARQIADNITFEGYLPSLGG